MNERIKELVKQAGGHFSTHNLMSNPVQHRESIELWDKNIERFAELIVKECMKESMDEIVADDEIAQEKDPLIREYLNGNNQGIVDAVVRFRNHFGVEE